MSNRLAIEAELVSRRGYALPAAYAGVFLLLVLFVVAVSILGDARDGDPVMSLTIDPRSADAAGADVKVPLVPAEPRKVNSYLVADPALLEQSRSGLLPKIAADGRTPRVAYAGPANAGETRPRVAVVITNLGIGVGETTVALSNLPTAVTFAFVPYAENLQD